MDPPNLRKKHEANDKNKSKGKVYSQKHIRITIDRVKESLTYRK